MSIDANGDRPLWHTIRQALVERYPRESFQLATKNAAWINCKTREDAINQFNTSLV